MANELPRNGNKPEKMYAIVGMKESYLNELIVFPSKRLLKAVI